MVSKNQCLQKSPGGGCSISGPRTTRFKMSRTHRRHIGDTSTTHRRHIGDTLVMFSTCSCKHRRCIFDVMISRMIWVIHHRFSRTALRSIGVAMMMFSPLCSVIQNTKVISSLAKISFGSHTGTWFDAKSLYFGYTLHKALYHRHNVVKTSPRHRQDITI